MHANQKPHFARGQTFNQLRPIADHCLLGENWVKQHMIVDRNWSLEHIGDVYQKLSKALNTCNVWMSAEDRYNRTKLAKRFKRLRTERYNGLNLLKRIRYPHTIELSNILRHRKALLRLYNDMPIDKIQESIDNRTFNMRKEYDRLNYEKQLLEKRLKDLLEQKGILEMRLHYKNDFRIEEMEKIALCKKKINDTHIRLQAAQTINATYTKMIQVLGNDANFYEKILESLVKDSEDQQNFITYILEIGRPAIRLFKRLCDGYKKRSEKYAKRSRKILQDVIINSKRLRKKSPLIEHSLEIKTDAVDIRKHYERASQSMKQLTLNLSNLEDILKIIKEATTASNVKNVLAVIKRQPYVTQNFKKQLTCYREKVKATRIQQKNCLVFKSLLMHNHVYPMAEIEKDLTELKQEIIVEDKIEEDLIAHMKEKAKVFVLLRYGLWSIYDIVNNVNIPKRQKISIKYSSPHLKLPLLKFDMLTMTACPPQAFEIELEKILKIIQIAVKKLMKVFLNMSLTSEAVKRYSQSFGDEIFISQNIDDDDEIMHSNFSEKDNRRRSRSYDYNDEEDLIKTWLHVPNRAKIKQRSAKIVEKAKRHSLL